MRELLHPMYRTALDAICEHEPHYQPNAAVLQALGDKTLTLIVGPCAVGKSYVIDTVATSDSRFRKSRSFTTRQPRSDDTPETIRYIPWTDDAIGQFCDDVTAGTIVNYTFHPKTGEIYGTDLTDHPGEHNLLPALATASAPLTKLPFRAVHTVGLVTTPDYWQKWFDKREFASDSERQGRIAEGITSVAWLLEHSEAAIIANIPNTGQDAARHIRQTTESNCPPLRDESTAEKLLDYLRHHV